MNSSFARLTQLLGQDALSILSEARVNVCGLGAVGSFALEALVRSGIGSIRAFDFDKVEISNINRQLLACHSSLGLPKTSVAAERIRDIAPVCKFEAIDTFLDKESIELVFENKPDIVLDAIDSLDSKILLIRECLKREVFLISSMGAAMRMDPLAVKVADFSKTHSCPLARSLRKRLSSLGIKGGFLAVFSSEAAIKSSIKKEDNTYSLGSFIGVTGSFGLNMATLAIKRLLERKN